ncbi:MAG: cytochrome c-type biogenesis protein [Oleiphilaceae bacterium]|nr:cytochrome c-type biogenesis protein [Oleiphilaceae bacterium]
MRRLFSASVGALLLIMAFTAAASIDVYEFETDQQRAAYLELIRELRCPKCQNQDIADSNAPIAQDMRAAVHRLLNEGKSHDEIVAYMVERFGDFVSYKPKVSSETYLLWFGPWLLLILGVVCIVVLGRKRASEKAASADQLSKQEQQRLQALLNMHTQEPNDSARSQEGQQE